MVINRQPKQKALLKYFLVVSSNSTMPTMMPPWLRLVSACSACVTLASSWLAMTGSAVSGVTISCAWLLNIICIYPSIVVCAAFGDHFSSCAILPCNKATLIGLPIGVVHSTAFNALPTTIISVIPAIALRLKSKDGFVASQTPIIAAIKTTITDAPYTPKIGI